jgi:hypothetical protein
MVEKGGRKKTGVKNRHKKTRLWAGVGLDVVNNRLSRVGAIGASPSSGRPAPESAFGDHRVDGGVSADLDGRIHRAT